MVMRSWKPEVIADSSGKWCGNALRFKGKDEAEEYARDLMGRWMLVTEWRVVESEDEPTHEWVGGYGGELKEIEMAETEVFPVGEHMAYDYEAQRWVEGPEAVKLKRKQLQEELDLVLSPKGPGYLEMIGYSRRGTGAFDTRAVADRIRKMLMDLGEEGRE